MKKTMRALTLLCALALLCVLANAAAVWIDTPAMRANAAQGAAMLGEQGATPQLAGGFKTAQLDNFTAVLILKTAAYTGGETALARTFGGFRTDLRAAEGENAWLAFCRYADGRESPTGGLSYSRYWHGYTLPLRLLLCFLNLANIQMLLLAAQGVMLICVVLLLQKRGMLRLAPGFLAAFFLMMPPVTGLCLQYAPVTLLMLCACAALLAGERRITQRIGMPGFFAAAGMLTAYFDLFTFPMVSLCFPLVMLLACRMQEGKSASALWQEGLFAAAAWGAGYAGFWALKWLINAAVFGRAYASGVLGQIALRVSEKSNGVQFTRLGALKENLFVIFSKSSYLLLLGLAAAASFAAGIHGKKKADIRALTLLLPMVIPICWMLITSNHVHDHVYYTYRNLTGAVFAGMAMLAALFGRQKNA